MIVTQLLGGLGNQLFQYAVARRLAIEYNSPFKLDISAFEHYPLRRYALDMFNILEEFVSALEISRLKPIFYPSRRSLFLIRKVQNLRYRKTWIRERYPYKFDDALFQNQRDFYLEGYWQNENYFKPIEDIIRREFTLKNTPDAYNAELIERIQKTDSVSVHIRRGDYATNSQTNAHHGLLPLSYYHSAFSRIIEFARSPNFFIFTDDPLWVQENLKFDDPMTFVEGNQTRPHEDLRLMSFCKHHIIANSSFSWWGAWLSTNPGKMVIAPKRWLKNSNIDTKDATPSSWERL